MKKITFLLIVMSMTIYSYSQDYLGWTSSELKDALSNKEFQEIKDGTKHAIYYTTEQLIQTYIFIGDTVVMHMTQIFNKSAISDLKKQLDSKLPLLDGEDSTWIDTKNKLRIELSMSFGFPTITIKKFGVPLNSLHSK